MGKRDQQEASDCRETKNPGALRNRGFALSVTFKSVPTFPYSLGYYEKPQTPTLNAACNGLSRQMSFAAPAKWGGVGGGGGGRGGGWKTCISQHSGPRGVW